MAVGESVTILHPAAATGTDAYGEPIAGTPPEEVVRVFNIAPGPSSEDNSGQSTVSVAWTVYMPASATVEHDARMIVRGDTYSVSGEPQEWRNRAGRTVGLVVELGASS